MPNDPLQRKPHGQKMLQAVHKTGSPAVRCLSHACGLQYTFDFTKKAVSEASGEQTLPITEKELSEQNDGERSDEIPKEVIGPSSNEVVYFMC